MIVVTPLVKATYADGLKLQYFYDVEVKNVKGFPVSKIIRGHYLFENVKWTDPTREFTDPQQLADCLEALGKSLKDNDWIGKKEAIHFAESHFVEGEIKKRSEVFLKELKALEIKHNIFIEVESDYDNSSCAVVLKIGDPESKICRWANVSDSDCFNVC